MWQVLAGCAVSRLLRTGSSHCVGASKPPIQRRDSGTRTVVVDLAIITAAGAALFALSRRRHD